MTDQVKVSKFGAKDILGYFFGDFANGLFFSLTASYLTLFYVDILGISAASVGILLVIARVWDAINDPIIGGWIDHLPSGSSGKFRPWILRMAIPVICFGMLSFTALPMLLASPIHVKLLYAYITYIGFGMTYTAINIPYGSMASVITDNEVERASLSMARSYGAIGASVLLSTLIPLLVFDENRKPQAVGFIQVVLFLGVLALICYVLCYKLSTERLERPKHQGSQGSISITLKGIAKNRPLIIQMLVGMISIGLMLVSSTLAPYLFKEYFQSTKALAFNGVIQIVCTLAVTPFIKPLVARFSKKIACVWGLLLFSFCWFIFFLFPITNLYIYFTLIGIGTCGLTVMNLLTWAFVPDAIDYQEYITGIREEGTIYAIYSFSRKIGQALAGFAGASVLIWVGYSVGVAEQSAETVLKIKQCSSAIPGVVGIVLALILGLGYNLDKKTLNMVTEELQKRRKTL